MNNYKTPNKLYNQDINLNRNRLIPQDRQKINNVEKFGPIPNMNTNNRNVNLNQNRIKNINSNENNEIGKAFLIIQNELKKKDNRILELERKIRELTIKYNSLTNNNSNQQKTTQLFGVQNMNRNNINEGVNELNKNENNIGIINQKRNNNIRNINQRKNFQIDNINYNSDSENIVKRFHGYGCDNLSHSNDNSVLTYNGVNPNSKKEVKEYLKEVKEKIDRIKFKEFIRNVKLLTSKNEIAPNREAIIDNMRNLFGKEHLDLFLRFEKIIGAGK